MTKNHISARERLIDAYRDPGSLDYVTLEYAQKLAAEIKQKIHAVVTCRVFERELGKMELPALEKDFRRLEIRTENDQFRRFMFPAHARDRYVATVAVAESEDQDEILKAVADFQDFSPENDPREEHDFGKVTVNGTDYFFKIDYYDENLEHGVDPYKEAPVRVLTVMRADEY